MAVQAYPSPARPHDLKREGLADGVYVRVGSTNRRADRELVEEMRRVARGEAFDEQPMPGLDSEGLDFGAASESFSPVRKLTGRDLETLRLTTSHQGRQVPTVGGMTPRATRTRLARLVGRGLVRELGTGPQDPKRRYFAANSLVLANFPFSDAVVTARLREQPRRVYVMGQRTKWGNCSARRNLSFNWRLILAPEFVLRYLVTHEAVQRAIPDHSTKFWLTVQSLCRETERAKQWLCSRQAELTIDRAAALHAV